VRRKSLTNSNPAEDLELRHLYRDANPYDEIARYFQKWDTRGYVSVPHPGVVTHMHGYDTTATEVHHIFGGFGGNRRWDRTWNLIHLHQDTHRFVERYHADGIALCLLRKLEKSEYDDAEAFRVLGKSPLGWLDGQRCEHAFAESVRLRVLAFAGRGAA
jgi:hypothetical protein